SAASRLPVCRAFSRFTWVSGVPRPRPGSATGLVFGTARGLTRRSGHPRVAGRAAHGGALEECSEYLPTVAPPLSSLQHVAIGREPAGKITIRFPDPGTGGRRELIAWCSFRMS